MRLNAKNIALANRLRDQVVKETEIVSDGEGVAMLLLWSFLTDHAESEGVELEQLARDQMEAFIEWARTALSMRRSH